MFQILVGSVLGKNTLDVCAEAMGLLLKVIVRIFSVLLLSMLNLLRYTIPLQALNDLKIETLSIVRH